MGTAHSKEINRCKRTSDISVNVDLWNRDVDSTVFSSREEKLVFQFILSLIDYLDNLTNRFKNYTGSSEKIQEAILNPAIDVEREALEAVKPAVYLLTCCYIVGKVVGLAVLYALNILTQGDCNLEDMEKHENIMYILGRLFYEVHRFDNTKIKTPQIQNDFSYYKRTFHKTIRGNGNVAQELAEDLVISKELTDRISFLFASPNPMFMNTVQYMLDNILDGELRDLEDLHELEKTIISKSGFSMESQVSKLVDLNNNVGDTYIRTYKSRPAYVKCLGMLIRIFLHTLKTKEEVLDFSKRCCIKTSITFFSLFYDHVDEHGLMRKSRSINLKYIVQNIKDKQSGYGDDLIETLRYNSKTLNTKDTPRSINKLLK